MGNLGNLYNFQRKHEMHFSAFLQWSTLLPSQFGLSQRFGTMDFLLKRVPKITPNAWFAFSVAKSAFWAPRSQNKRTLNHSTLIFCQLSYIRFQVSSNFCASCSSSLKLIQTNLKPF